MSRDITPFGLRMPTELKQQVDAAAAASGRSINAEIIDRLRHSLGRDTETPLAQIPDGILLDEVVNRYGARLQIIIADDVAAEAGISTPGSREK